MSAATLELLRELRARIVHALEAVELGQPTMAAAILRDLEERIGQAQAAVIARQMRRRRRRQRVLCDSCGAGFDWPGELAEHRRRVHGDEDAA